MTSSRRCGPSCRSYESGLERTIARTCEDSRADERTDRGAVKLRRAAAAENQLSARSEETLVARSAAAADFVLQRFFPLATFECGTHGIFLGLVRLRENRESNVILGLVIPFIRLVLFAFAPCLGSAIDHVIACFRRHVLHVLTPGTLGYSTLMCAASTTLRH